ncbi:MAG: GNAT family N-acetyltransferase [Acidobacteriota bacterium]
MIDLIQAESQAEIDEARRLFREYETWLDEDLCFQSFEEEVRNLPGKYAPPDGRLFIAYSDGNPAGCVAMRKLNDGICEMKRLFVRPQFQGHGIGNFLIEKIIDSARAAGYEKLRLDTYPPKMGKAVKLYESHGFYLIDAYYENPYDVLFMELAL